MGLITGAEEVGRLERSPTAWRPVLWPIKAIMCLGVFLMLLQAVSELFKDILRIRGEADLMSYEMIAILMFSTMMLMLLTGQRVFGAIGFVAVVAALLLWGDRGGHDLAFSAAMKLMKWYPLLTLPMFIFMGYVLSESPASRTISIACSMSGWAGFPAGWRWAPSGLMVLISAMNGLSVAGMAIGATIALPELLSEEITTSAWSQGVIQAGSSLWAYWCRPRWCWCCTR